MRHRPHVIDAAGAKQHTIALSSAEAEFYAVGRLAASLIMMRSLVAQVGIDLPPTPVAFMGSDAGRDAGRALATRLGVGHIRHLQVRCL